MSIVDSTTNRLRDLANRLMDVIEQPLTIETQAFELTETTGGMSPPKAFKQPEAFFVASTVIRLDGDSQAILPMRKDEKGQMQVDAALLDYHNKTIELVIEYRTRLINTLLSLASRENREVVR